MKHLPEPLDEMPRISQQIAPQLFLMAHGASDNDELRNLSAVGRLQAARAITRLATSVSQLPQTIVSSPIARARQTALIASQNVQGGPLPVTVDSRLDLSGAETPHDLMSLALDLSYSNTPTLIVTAALELELMACGLCARAPGRRRIPSENTLPRGLHPATIVELSQLEGYWRISQIYSGKNLI